MNQPTINLDVVSTLLQQGNVAGAIKALENITQEHPSDLSLRHEYARLLEHAQQLPQAIDVYIQSGNTGAAGEIAFKLGAQFFRTEDWSQAAHYFELAHKLLPDIADIWINLGATYTRLCRHDEALILLKKAANATNKPQAWLNLGFAYKATEKWEEAVEAYTRAIRQKTDYAEAYYNRSSVYQRQGNFEPALHDSQHAFELFPKSTPRSSAVLGDIIYRKLHLCQWDGWQDTLTRFEEQVRQNPTGIHPLQAISVLDDPALQQRCAESFIQHKYGHTMHAAKPPQQRVSQSGERLHIGYISSDMHHHATAFLMAGMFAEHNREQFRVSVYSHGAPDTSDHRQRIASSVDHFHNLHGQSDDAIAHQIESDKVDILIDLKGHTYSSRLEILALKPAPIQAHYLGYPGTLGAPFLDYFIGDEVVTPANVAAHFNERALLLPTCYQVNDAKRPLPTPEAHTRAAHGLPDAGIVFACFNQNYKITPDVFARWMEILKQTPNSVLWLYLSVKEAGPYLLREAEKQGIARERIIFAYTERDYQRHLSRLALADIFLDTYPVCAHTTGSDALWAGIPIITYTGNSMVSRVATSLLHTHGMDELAASDWESYVNLAVTLANDTDRRKHLREQLAAKRTTSRLFDPAYFTKQFEEMLLKMAK